MPAWNEVYKEIVHKADPSHLAQKYLNLLFKKRSRNIIVYYSGWLQKPGVQGAEINDNDTNSFMCVIHKLDRSKGLDLILHTPGGEVTATESLVEYLKEMFDSDIEVFVPQLAMSAGTMIACAAKLIHMGKQSSLGPIDPQINGLPVGAILKEFGKAAKATRNKPEEIPLWQVIYSQCLPSMIVSCEQAIELAGTIAVKWLEEGMLADEQEKNASDIVEQLLDHGEMKTHNRHIGIKKAQKIGLKVKPLEKDQELQDLVLTIHHTYMYALAATPALKIIENHKGVGLQTN